MLYHAHVGILHGGYVGVDIFFVVSGYLITGLLWGELRNNHSISLSSFYARRDEPVVFVDGCTDR